VGNNNPPPIPLKELVATSSLLRRELKPVYDLLPATKCWRQVRCCSLLPEMTFLEALQVFSALESWPPADRLKVTKKIARYFLSNALGISSCPFLQGRDCLIYPDRFFGCRAYGLWSRDYYQNLADQNRQGKRVLRQQWENLGISLPGEVLYFEIPYCSRVETDSPAMITDELLSAASDRIENLSGELNPWDREFREKYFSDLSFFLTGLQFGPREAVRLKYFITKDIIQKADRTLMDQALSRVVDLFEKEPGK
jgi:Fe-S-cluster containining protein